MQLFTQGFEELREDCKKEGCAYIKGRHTHNNKLDEAVEIWVVKEDYKWVVITARSGGRNESVWNEYRKEFSELTEALIYGLNKNI